MVVEVRLIIRTSKAGPASTLDLAGEISVGPPQKAQSRQVPAGITINRLETDARPLVSRLAGLTGS